MAALIWWEKTRYLDRGKVVMMRSQNFRVGYEK